MKSAAQLLTFCFILRFLCGCQSGTQRHQVVAGTKYAPLSTITSTDRSLLGIAVAAIIQGDDRGCTGSFEQH